MSISLYMHCLNLSTNKPTVYGIIRCGTYMYMYIVLSQVELIVLLTKIMSSGPGSLPHKSRSCQNILGQTQYCDQVKYVTKAGMIFFSYLAGFSYFLVAKIFRKLQDTVRIVQKLPFERGCRWLQLFSLVFSYLFSNQNHPCNRIPPHIMRSDVNEIVTTPLFITNSWKRVYI